MPVINFTFRPESTPAQREGILNAIAQWPEVASAAPLKPNAKIDSLQRMAYARIPQKDHLEELLHRLSSQPCIEEASIAAQRHSIK